MYVARSTRMCTWWARTTKDKVGEKNTVLCNPLFIIIYNSKRRLEFIYRKRDTEWILVLADKSKETLVICNSVPYF